MGQSAGEFFTPTEVGFLMAEIVRGDSMRNPKFRATDGTRLRQFPLIIANPMWNQTFDPDVFENDGFDRFERQGGNTSGKGDWAWLQHTAACLADGGRAAIVLDTGAVSRGSGSKNEDKERAIRKWFVEQDLIDGVVLLPDNLFYNTNAAGVIIFLRRANRRTAAAASRSSTPPAKRKKERRKTIFRPRPCRKSPPPTTPAPTCPAS